MTYLPELSREEMLRMLAEERVGRVGLNDTLQPYVVPTDFAFGDGAIYIHTPDRGLKARLARRDPHVCFEVDRYNATVTDFRSVIVRGRMTEVSDPLECASAMLLLRKKSAGFDHASVFGAAKERPRSLIAIFKIEIGDMTGVRSHNNGH